MSFEVVKEILPDEHHARLTVTFDAETFDLAKRQAARELSKHLKIPGFRPGKAPYAVVVRRVGEGAIVEEAIDALLEAHYSAILEQAEVEPAYPGTLKEVASLDPLTLVIEVPLKPEVDLGDYKAVRVPYEPPEVDEEEVERALDNMRRMYVSIEPVERPAQMGDVVVMDLWATVHPRPGSDEEPRTVEEGETALLVKEADDPEEWPFPGFGKALEGVQAGDEKTLEYIYPDDAPDPDLRGRKVTYRLQVKEVQTPVVPELTDEFVQENTEFSTVEELRQAVREEVAVRKQRQYDEEYANQVLDAVLEGTSFKIPKAMLDEEIKATRHLLVTDLGGEEALEQVLQQEEMLREDFEQRVRDIAERRIKVRLLLDAIAREEQLDLSQDELQTALQATVEHFLRTTGIKEARRLLRDPEIANQMLFDAIHAELGRKVIAFLTDLARGRAGAEAEPPSAAEEPPAAEADAPTAVEPAADTSPDATPGDSDAAAPVSEPEAQVPDTADASTTDNATPTADASTDEPS